MEVPSPFYPLPPPTLLPEDQSHTTHKADEVAEAPLNSPATIPPTAVTDGAINTDSDLGTTRSVLGTLYQEQLNQRMSGRQERRVNLTGLDLTSIEHFGAVCLAYQALKIQVHINEVVICYSYINGYILMAVMLVIYIYHVAVILIVIM